MSKLGILLGAGVGYVLGTRDGRERYEQIQQQVRRVWKDPRVQQKKEEAAEVAKQKGGELQDKVSEKASEASSDTASGTASYTSTDPAGRTTPGAGAGGTTPGATNG